jgi:hypothetical protein
MTHETRPKFTTPPNVERFYIRFVDDQSNNRYGPYILPGSLLKWLVDNVKEERRFLIEKETTTTKDYYLGTINDLLAKGLNINELVESLTE